MRLRFILIFGNKLIHSYNHDFNYHPNLQHRTIHSTIYSDDWLVNTVIMLLIIIGGIGFLVWDDLSVKKFQWKKYHLHTKIVLSTTGFLIIGGAVLFLILEKNNVLAGMPVKEQILCSLFHSVTARTAGFNTTDTGALTEGSKLVTMILMFIGGSPGSTAGGIKTTTVVVLIVFVRANLMEAAGCNVFNRRLDETAIRKASVVMCTNLFLILTGTIFMEIMQPLFLSTWEKEVEPPTLTNLFNVQSKLTRTE